MMFCTSYANIPVYMCIYVPVALNDWKNDVHLGMKGCISHFTKLKIHPFISKVTVNACILKPISAIVFFLLFFI